MNLSPLQLDTNCFNNVPHYHHSYYTNNMPAWSSSSSSSPASSSPPPSTTNLLCPSNTINYQPSSVPSALQPIENYCRTESYYPPPTEPIVSSSEHPFYASSSPQYLSIPPPPPIIGHIYSPENYPIPTSSSSSSTTTMMAQQNRANYTRHQLVMLNEIFKKHKYPNSLQKTLIANYIGVSRDQIRIWFQNKRRKVQLINKGQAKQTKTDVECEYGEYRRHLPKNYLDDLYEELYKARGAPARLPVKRENNTKTAQIDEEPQQQQPSYAYYPTMNSNYYYPPNNILEHDDSSSHGQSKGDYFTNYTQRMYSDRL